MIERCPCCKGRLKENNVCSRCQADLSSLINAQKAAKTWLSKALQFLLSNKIEQSCIAIKRSLYFEETAIAKSFYDFLIQQQITEVLTLLAQADVISAKKRLYQIRLLIPSSKKLQQLDGFANYLLLAK